MNKIRFKLSGTITHPKFKLLWFWVGSKTHRIEEDFEIPAGFTFEKDFGMVEVHAGIEDAVAKLRITSMDGSVGLAELHYDIARQATGKVETRVGSVRLNLDVVVTPSL